MLAHEHRDFVDLLVMAGRQQAVDPERVSSGTGLLASRGYQALAEPK